jgi:diaminopimelate epimerase
MLQFLKMDAASNDFVLVDAREVGERDWVALARELCARHTGVGSDGLLVVGPSEVADFRFRMFNPDGTEDHCGNGIRCGLLCWADGRGEWRETELSAETLAGVVRARGWRSDSGQVSFEVAMGRADFSPESVPARLGPGPLLGVPLEVEGEELRVTSLSTGTAHTVIFGREPISEERFQRLSPRIENHPAFPERTSVLWTQIPEGEGPFRVRIWERAVGETLACGTGACAVAAAAWAHGLAEGEVAVRSAGGTLSVKRDAEGVLYLTGPVRYVFGGEWMGGAGRWVVGS